jgi:CSLREA domain-containing protein
MLLGLRRVRVPLLVLLALGGWLGGGLYGKDAMAALSVFYVNTQTDSRDAVPGDTECSDSTSFGHCSLRAAIEEANANVVGGNTQIYVPAGLYKLELGQLVITAKTVFIDGAGPAETILDGNSTTRVFDIAGSAVVMIRGVMIQNGKAGKSDDRVFGTHYHGGGIHNHGTLFLENSALSGNYAPAGGAPSCIGACGGGLYNAGSAGLINVTVAYNGADAAGGGIANGGNLDLHYVTLADNLASNGGGLYNNAGSATLFTTIVANNDGLSPANNCGWPITGSPNPPADGGYNLQHSIMAPDPQSCGHNIQVADPGLDPVKNANGSAIYYRLYKWSPAIDGVLSETRPGCGGIDQRRVDRPQDGNDDGVKRCDIGSYERRPTDP